MKKITVALMFFFGFFVTGMAQTATATTKADKKAAKETAAAQKKADKESAKEATLAQKKSDKEAKISQKSTGTNKDGSPDMRLKTNKQPKMQAPVQTQATIQPKTQATVQPKMQATTQPQVKPQAQPQARVQVQKTQMAPMTNAKATDNAIGTDAKGRTIYQGPKGGKYYINKNGNKEYLPKDK